METLATTQKYEKWEELLKQEQDEKLISALEEASEVDAAEFLGKQEPRTMVQLLTQFNKEKQSQLFQHLDQSRWSELYYYLPQPIFAELFSNLPSDQRVDLYQKLSDKEQARLLPFLTKKVKEDVIMLSAYPPETAGGIMSTDFATILGSMTAQQAIEKLRIDSPSKKMIYYLYVVNKSMQMIGFVSLKDLIMAEPSLEVKEMIHKNFTFADVYEDRESVARKIEKYNLMAIPILNEEEQLVGTVSYEDAIEVIQEEHTEDMEKFMGITHTEEGNDYLNTTSVQHFRRRVSWVVGLFMLSFLSQYIIKRYEHSLATHFAILSIYIPMIMDAGGNAGSQSATVVIRALSLGQVTLRSWFKIIYKETKVALMLATCLFLLAFLKVALFSLTGTSTHDAKPYNVAFAISLAVSLQVISATIIGAILPLIAKLLNGDPAVAASPAITTIVDITGMFIYFSTAVLMLL